jgi:hypothetical protein
VFNYCHCISSSHDQMFYVNFVIIEENLNFSGGKEKKKSFFGVFYGDSVE